MLGHLLKPSEGAKERLEIKRTASTFELYNC